MRLDVSEARTLFELMDYDQSGEVNIYEFLDACVRLQGESRRIDMKIMQCEVRYLHESFKRFQEVMDDAFGGQLRRLQAANSEKRRASARLQKEEKDDKAEGSK